MGIGPSFACSGPPCVNRDPEQHRGVCSPSLSEGRLLWPCREPMHVVGSVRVWATLVPAFGNLQAATWNFVILLKLPSLMLPLLHLSFSALFSQELPHVSGVCVVEPTGFVVCVHQCHSKWQGLLTE